MFLGLGNNPALLQHDFCVGGCFDDWHSHSHRSDGERCGSCQGHPMCPLSYYYDSAGASGWVCFPRFVVSRWVGCSSFRILAAVHQWLHGVRCSEQIISLRQWLSDRQGGAGGVSFNTIGDLHFMATLGRSLGSKSRFSSHIGKRQRRRHLPCLDWFMTLVVLAVMHALFFFMSNTISCCFSILIQAHSICG